MDQETPKCFLGCCDVRRYTQIFAIISIILSALLLTFSVLLLISLVFIFFKGSDAIQNKVENYDLAIKLNILIMFFNCIIYANFLYYSIKLRKAVTDRDPAPIKLFLFLTLALMVNSIIGICILLIKPNFLQIKTSEDDQSANLINMIVSGVVFILSAVCIYPVYQYYKFEKSRQGNTQVV